MNAGAAQVAKTRAGLKPALLAAGVVALAMGALGAKFCLEHGLTWTCPSILLFGIPCPGCGGTRAFAALAQLDFVAAFRFNPMLVMAMFAALPAFFGKLNWNRWSRRTWTIIGALFVLNWMYLIFFLPRA